MPGAYAITELHHIIPQVSKTTIHEAVTEKLGYRKLCACWVSKMLTDNYKTKRMGSALKCLTNRKEMSFWTPVSLEMKHWVFTTLLNPRNHLLRWEIVRRNAPRIWQDFGTALPVQTRLTQTKPVLPLSNEHG